jgi:hypothetical protein
MNLTLVHEAKGVRIDIDRFHGKEIWAVRSISITKNHVIFQINNINFVIEGNRAFDDFVTKLMDRGFVPYSVPEKGEISQ